MLVVKNWFERKISLLYWRMKPKISSATVLDLKNPPIAGPNNVTNLYKTDNNSNLTSYLNKLVLIIPI